MPVRFFLEARGATEEGRESNAFDDVEVRDVSEVEPLDPKRNSIVVRCRTRSVLVQALEENWQTGRSSSRHVDATLASVLNAFLSRSTANFSSISLIGNPLIVSGSTGPADGAL